VAYLLLTGHEVFSGNTVVEICGHHLHTPPTPPSELTAEPLPADLEALVLRCLAKDRAERPQTARELLSALQACDVGRWTDDDARSWWSEHAD
jgi:serine/threonine-protein kinase